MSQGQELQNLGSTHSHTGYYSGISGSRHRIRDEQTLARLGKKQVLKVCYDKSSPFARRTRLTGVRSDVSDFFLSSDSAALSL